MKNLAIMSVTTLSLISTSHSLERVASHVHKIVPALMVAATTAAVAADNFNEGKNENVLVTPGMRKLIQRTESFASNSYNWEIVRAKNFSDETDPFSGYYVGDYASEQRRKNIIDLVAAQKPSSEYMSLDVIENISELLYEQFGIQRISPAFDYTNDRPELTCEGRNSFELAINWEYFAFLAVPHNKERLKKYLSTYLGYKTCMPKLAQLLDQDPVPQEFHDAFSHGIFKLD